MSRDIAAEVSTGIGWGAFATIGMLPPRDPDEEDEDEGGEEDEDEEDSADEPAVVREPDED